jgi:glycosyltransferase involved in cell wall biosynthesis
VLLSIVTSVLNGEPYIADMLASVPVSETLEHLVIDAGSTDGTLERLRTQPMLRLIERPGCSLYEAWNEAIACSRGDALLFLNADDRLVVEGLEAVLHVLAGQHDGEIVCGQADAFTERAGDVSVESSATQYPTPGDALNLLALTFGAPAINAKVFRRGVFERFGRFDTQYRLAADRAYLLDLALAGKPPQCVPVRTKLYSYRVHAGSMTMSHSWKGRAEMAREHCQIADKLLASPAVSGETASLLSAWRSRETLAEAVSTLGRADFPPSLPPLMSLVRGFPGVIGDLARARKLRRRWLNRVQHDI